MRESLIYGAATHTGLVRANNEDNYAILDHDGSFPCALILADGMGGHRRGELASQIAVNYARSRLLEEMSAGSWPEDKGRLLTDIIEKANVKVYLGSLESEDNHGMGTTMTMALMMDHELNIAHVGDCRAYLLRDNELVHLTIDHTLVQEMVDAGTLSPDETMGHPRRNVLTRALGIPEYIQPDIAKLSINRGDRLLLCSDGLHGFVSEDDIRTQLRKEKNPAILAEKLITLALNEGGEDNVTVLAVYL